MIYEGQAKRRMARILERRTCVCPKCNEGREAIQAEMAALRNQRIDNHRMSVTRIPLSKFKKKEEA